VQWLLDALAGLVGWLLGGPQSSDVGTPDGGEDDTLADEQERMNASLAEFGGRRVVERQRIGRPLSEDGVTLEQEHVDYADGLTQTHLIQTELRLCSCGTVISGDNPVLGLCTVCARPVCRTEGCASRCSRCGGLICTDHAREVRGRIYCVHHMASAYFASFWEGLE